VVFSGRDSALCLDDMVTSSGHKNARALIVDVVNVVEVEDASGEMIENGSFRIDVWFVVIVIIRRRRSVDGALTQVDTIIDLRHRR
jgi:hypothetical protein